MMSRRTFVRSLGLLLGAACAAPAPELPRTYEELVKYKMAVGLDPWFKLASFVTDEGVLRIDDRKLSPNKATFMPFSPKYRLDTQPWRPVEIRLFTVVDAVQKDGSTQREYEFELQFNDGQQLKAVYRPERL